MSWLTGYSFRKSVTITGSIDGALSDFQMKLEIAYDSDMQADFDDLRFTTDDGETEIDFWLEEKTDSTSAVVWVEVPSIAASPDETIIYMYYGNPSAESASDGDATMIFFDDFEYDDAITNHGWASGASLPSTDQAVSGTRSLKILFGHDDRTGDIIDDNTVLEFDFYDPSLVDSANIFAGITNTAIDGRMIIYKDDDWSTTKYVSRYGVASYDISSIDQSVAWHHAKIIHTTGGSCTPYIDDAVNPTRTVTGTIGIIRYYGYSTWYADNVIVRKYTANEPSYEIGAEAQSRNCGALVIVDFSENPKPWSWGC